MCFSFLEIALSVCCAYVEDFVVVRYLSEMEGFEWNGCCMLLVNAIELNEMG
mgnify:FL=1